jgi:hypothetical protein
VVTLLDEGDKTKQAFQEIERVGGVDIVRAVESQRGEYALEVLPKSDDDLRPAIFRAVVSGGHTLVGLSREGQNLEEIFRQLTIGKA